MEIRMLTNLLKETLSVLTANGKSPADVRWVGTRAGSSRGTWAQFEKIADFNYDSDFGARGINDKLVVVGDDWWLERCDYDGSEWWGFKTAPRAATSKPTDLCHDDLIYRY